MILLVEIINEFNDTEKIFAISPTNEDWIKNLCYFTLYIDILEPDKTCCA